MNLAIGALRGTFEKVAARYLHEIVGRLRLGEHPRLAVEQRHGHGPDGEQAVRLSIQHSASLVNGSLVAQSAALDGHSRSEHETPSSRPARDRLTDGGKKNDSRGEGETEKAAR